MIRFLSFFCIPKVLLDTFSFKKRCELSIYPYSISKNNAPSRSMSSPSGAMNSME